MMTSRHEQPIDDRRTSRASRCTAVHRFGLALCAAAMVSPLGGVSAKPAPVPPPTPERHASARLEPSAGSSVRGHATLGETDDGVRMFLHAVANRRGTYEVSLVDDDDCPRERVSDEDDALALGELKIDEDGRGALDAEIPEATLIRGDNSVVGRAIVIYRDHVDACGVVQRPSNE
jgi:hypothetical protein